MQLVPVLGLSVGVCVVCVCGLEARRQEVFLKMMAKDLKVNTQERPNNKPPSTSPHPCVGAAHRTGVAWPGPIPPWPSYMRSGGAGRGAALAPPPASSTPTIIRLSVFSSLRPRSVSSLMPLYPYTYTLDHSAKMLAARGIYKAVARRGVHTTRVLASTKRK